MYARGSLMELALQAALEIGVVRSHRRRPPRPVHNRVAQVPGPRDAA
jgi:hypothetical protein